MSTNLSKIRRDKMLNTISKIKENIDDEETLQNLSLIEYELTKKKYGLLWEEHEEKVDEELKTKIPTFEEVKDKEIVSNKDDKFNFLLEGDNLHSLYLLEKTHKGKIDVIYIDPPYNTGNKDFIYDDDMIDKEDGFSHSKWLSFMEKRLLIAKKLLNENGVIFISIDDCEQAPIKMLCDDIFGDNNFIANLPRITKKSGKDHADGIAKNNDYVLVYTKDKNKSEFKGIIANEEKYPLKDEYFNERGGYKLNQTLDYDSLWYNTNMDFPIEVDNYIYYAGGTKEGHDDRHNGNHKPKDWVWRWSLEKFKFGLENGFVVIKKGKDRPRIYTKTYANASISNSRPYKIEYKERETKLSSIALIENEFSNDNAKKEITKLGLDEFGFPKPTSLIKQLISICKNQNNILDFFAGSGTTGQAVLELNDSDNENRHFILCTNNENKICEDITYQRLKTVISGTRKDNTKYSDGINANLKYYRTTYIPRINTDEENIQENLLVNIKNLIQLENGISVDDERIRVILDEDEIDRFSLNNEEVKQCERLYISSDILLTAQQVKTFEDNNVEVFIIPEYYFDNEIKEVQ